MSSVSGTPSMLTLREVLSPFRVFTTVGSVSSVPGLLTTGGSDSLAPAATTTGGSDTPAPAVSTIGGSSPPAPAASVPLELPSSDAMSMVASRGDLRDGFSGGNVHFFALDACLGGLVLNPFSPRT